MGKKLFVVFSAVFFPLIFTTLALACGCGGGGGQNSCHGSAQADSCGRKQDSCQDPASMSGGQQQQTEGAASVISKEAVNAGNKICPVLGEKINELTKVTYAYEGKIYNLCCAGCIDQFKNDPQKYIQKVNEELKAGS